MTLPAYLSLLERAFGATIKLSKYLADIMIDHDRLYIKTCCICCWNVQV